MNKNWLDLFHIWQVHFQKFVCQAAINIELVALISLQFDAFIMFHAISWSSIIIAEKPWTKETEPQEDEQVICEAMDGHGFWWVLPPVLMAMIWGMKNTWIKPWLLYVGTFKISLNLYSIIYYSIL